MSLEATISELTAAIRGLTVALSYTNSQPAPAPAPVIEAPAAETVVEVEPASVPGKRRGRPAKAEVEAKREAVVVAPQPVAEVETVEEDVEDVFPPAIEVEEVDEIIVEDVPEAKPATLDDARTIIMQIAQKLGRERGAALIAQFGGRKLGDIDPAKYGDLVFRGEAILRGAAE